jgi:5-methylcytosine-specific restriction protein A
VARKRDADRRRGTARERGYTSEWERESKAFLALPENRLCACGCGQVADMVDHRKPHRGARRLFWDRANWQGMKRGCHSRKTAATDGGFGNPSKGGDSQTFGRLGPDRAGQQRAIDSKSPLGTGRR